MIKVKIKKYVAPSKSRAQQHCEQITNFPLDCYWDFKRSQWRIHPNCASWPSQDPIKLFVVFGAGKKTSKIDLQLALLKFITHVTLLDSQQSTHYDAIWCLQKMHVQCILWGIDHYWLLVKAQIGSSTRTSPLNTDLCSWILLLDFITQKHYRKHFLDFQLVEGFSCESFCWHWPLRWRWIANHCLIIFINFIELLKMLLVDLGYWYYIMCIVI